MDPRGGVVTVLYTISGVPEEEDDDDTPNAFQVPYPRSGVFRAHDLISRFPPTLSAAGQTPDSPAWQFSTVQPDGSRVEVEGPAAPIYVNRDGTVVLEAVLLARAPLYSKHAVQQQQARRQASLGDSGDMGNRRRGSSGGGLQQFVETGTETAKSLLSVVGGAVAKAAERLSTETVNIEDRKFRVLRELAEGGFSKVYLVRESGTTQEYAMKQMLCFTAEAAKDAASEMSILKDLRGHRNIVDLITGCSSATTKGGQRCREFLFVFPFYPRGTAWDAIAKASSVGRWPFSEKQALSVFLGSCMGLLELHNRGLAHWDIKPHNLLLADDGTPVLMDFGSVTKAHKELKDRRAALLLEEEAAKKCSPAYRAPELTQVEVSKVVDTRVDVWAMGCTLYAMAFGRNPFESPTEGVLKLAILNGRFAFPSDSAAPLGSPRFSPQYCNLVRYCLNPEPSQRPLLKDVITQTRALLAV